MIEGYGKFRFIAMLGGKQMQKKKKVIPIVVVLFVVFLPWDGFIGIIFFQIVFWVKKGMQSIIQIIWQPN